MENLTHEHTLTDFWKIPASMVAFEDEREDEPDDPPQERIRVAMPPWEDRAKPGLYQWEGASLYAPAVGVASPCDDISEAVRVDPALGRVSLPFNLDQAVTNLLTEQYLQQETGHSLICLARRIYYKIKPLVPRFVQIRLRQKAVDRMCHRKFPAWEIDASVDLLHRNLLAKLLQARPAAALPMISFWPQGAEMCLLLTHDVETSVGIGNILKIANIEQRLGFRSAWNFVPERYPLDPCILSELQACGFEIGVHSLHHDGRLFESYRLFQQRAERINHYLRQWRSVGFRSESNLRNLEWISALIQAQYDSSCVSSEWYGAQPGGSCTVFPFVYRGLVELPITLQQDFTLLDILKLSPKSTLEHWMATVQSIKKLNGLALLNTHPDYMTSPERLRLYEQFLEYMQSERHCWHTLPREAAGWWLDRRASKLLQIGDEWRILGPASDRGRVRQVSLRESELVFN